MHEMEEGVRSRGGFVKKKNSSGCLIIKKKWDGLGGVGSSGSRKFFEPNKERKRSRLVLSDSGSSEESLQPIRRRVVPGTDESHHGSVVYRMDIEEDRKLNRNGKIDNERKRRLDVFDFNEYDGFDGKRMKEGYLQDRFKLTGQSGNGGEFETGSSRHVMIYKRKNSYFGSTGTSSGGRKEVPDYAVKSRFEMEDDEAHLPISSLRQKFRVPSDEPIRLQGKNGVLKVMVKKKKKMDLPQKLYDHQLEVADRKGSKSENAIKKKSVGPLFHSESERPEKSIPAVRIEKSELKLRKPVSKAAKACNFETGDRDTPLKQGSTSAQARGSSKGVKSEGRAPSTEKATPVRGKEVKINRGSGTEKQLLREKIRHMLVSAGWTIDYRPRRNRDYLDAVYINPSGTAYWSIIKAYDALKKQLDEEDIDVKPTEDSSAFTPLSEELLSKLTRQTRKKIEKEMKMKRRDHGGSKNARQVSREESEEGTDGDKDDEKLNFFLKQNGKSRKGRSRGTTFASGDDSSSNSSKGSLKQERPEKLSTATNSHIIPGRKSRKIGRCTLLVRNSDNGLNSETDGFVPYTGKRTLLSWLIDSGRVLLSEKLQYMNRRRTRVMQEGWITRDGIHCGCCSKILTVSKFEIHAGSKLHQPFQNIFLESGVSLLQCQIDAWNRQEESIRYGFYTVDIDGDDPNDDTCGLCGDGGDLICCDGCPSTFHQCCLDIQMLPPGDWHCPNCSCKFCGIASGNSAQGNHSTVSVLLTCTMCEKKYHGSCSQEIDATPADFNLASTPFCGQKCQEISDHLQKLLGVKHELEPGFSWSLIRRTDLDADTSHRGFPQRVECNSKLAVALSVMDECFLPIIDRRSRINLIHNVLYNCGSNFSRLNYSGFYTAILERGDEIISAASLRIHGTQLAEMPFIGTRHVYRRQGMCRRLLCAIELALCSLKIEKLIIPAIAEHMHTWTVVFGFNSLEDSHQQEMRSMNMLVFPGVDMLQKLLVEQKTTEGNITTNSGAESILVKKGKTTLDSQPVKKPIESSADLKCPPPNVDHVCLEMEKTELDSVKVNSSEEGAVDDVHKAIVKVDKPILDSVVETSTVSATEEINRDQDPLSTSTVNGIDEPMKQSNSNWSPGCAAGMECKLQVASKLPSKAKVELVEGGIQPSAEGHKDDAHQAMLKTSCAGLVLDSVGEISVRNTEKVIEDQDPVSESSHDSHVCILQLRSDSNQPDAHVMEDKLNVASQVSDAEVVSDVTPIEGNARSSGESESGDAHKTNNFKVACVKPVLESSGDVSGQNTIEEINDKLNHISFSNMCCTGESIMRCNSDLNHQSTLEMQSEFLVVSEVSSATEVAPVKNNIRSSVESNVGDSHEINGKVVCVEPGIDCLGEISAQNKDINEDLDPAPASALNGSNDSTVEFNSDLEKQITLEVQSNLFAASKVASNEEVALVGRNTVHSAENVLGKDVHKVSDTNASSIGTVLNSSGGTSMGNVTEQNKENLAVSTFHESDGSSI